jgi:SAM-dependent methyltransferase
MKPVAHDSLPRSLRPLSRVHSVDRGNAIDRYYIDQFLSAHSSDIRGYTIETGDDRYTRKFGGNRVARSDVLHLVAGNPKATIVGNLETGEGVPRDAFDCMLVINTLSLIYDVRAAISNCYRALRAGGVLLANFHGICPRCPEDVAWSGDYWRFTSQSVRRMCEEVFQAANVEVKVYGNVLASCAYLYGLSADELTSEELDHRDRNFELIIAVRAVVSQ